MEHSLNPNEQGNCATSGDEPDKCISVKEEQHLELQSEYFHEFLNTTIKVENLESNDFLTENEINVADIKSECDLSNEGLDEEGNYQENNWVACEICGRPLDGNTELLVFTKLCMSCAVSNCEGSFDDFLAKAYGISPCVVNLKILGKLPNTVKRFDGSGIDIKEDDCDNNISESVDFSRSVFLIDSRPCNEETTFVCNECHRSFSNKRKLKKHLAYHGFSIRPYSCKICKKTFTTQWKMKRHTEECHVQQRPFSCRTCGKTFTRRASLLRHIFVAHTEERPFVCPICEKTFAKKHYLTLHKRIHTGEKLFTCDTCNTAFTNHSTLISHVRVHTKERPFLCKTCKKTFARSSTLVRHIRVHTKEKPFTCAICDTSVSRKYLLEKHIRLKHTKLS